jgi:predicted outer membrane repeat protein
MLGRLSARVAVFASAGAVGLAGLWPAEVAASAVIDVPCSATALAAEFGSAAAGETLSLAARCRYELTAALPVVDQDLTIEGNGATLERSYAPGTPAFVTLTVDAGTLTIADLNLSHGDGAISVGGAGSLTVQGGRFSGNTANVGGAIDSETFDGTVSVTDATFINNTASGGGAIFDFNVQGVSVTDSRFYRNQAADGGAILNDSITGEDLGNVTIHNNSATDNGGGVYSIYAPIRVTGSWFSGNHAGGQGGGAYVSTEFYADFGMQMTGTIVRANSAQEGGGIYGQDTVVDLTSTVIHDNVASADGGGLSNNGDPESDNILNIATSVISGNQAGGYGGALYNQGRVAAKGTLIARNTAAVGGGGIFDGPQSTGVTLAGAIVLHNHPDNCEPLGSIPGCTDSVSAAHRIPASSPSAPPTIPPSHRAGTAPQGPWPAHQWLTRSRRCGCCIVALWPTTGCPAAMYSPKASPRVVGPHSSSAAWATAPFTAAIQPAVVSRRFCLRTAMAAPPSLAWM